MKAVEQQQERPPAGLPPAEMAHLLEASDVGGAGYEPR